jgi:hypothetical protein
VADDAGETALIQATPVLIMACLPLSSSTH